MPGLAHLKKNYQIALESDNFVLRRGKVRFNQKTWNVFGDKNAMFKWDKFVWCNLFNTFHSDTLYEKGLYQNKYCSCSVSLDTGNSIISNPQVGALIIVRG